jgi:hypothetical protein
MSTPHLDPTDGIKENICSEEDSDDSTLVLNLDGRREYRSRPMAQLAGARHPAVAGW